MPPDILERLTWRDVTDMVKGWRKYPPLQRMLQDWLKAQGLVYNPELEEMSEAVPAGAWFSGLSGDEFTSALQEKAGALATKLKLH